MSEWEERIVKRAAKRRAAMAKADQRAALVRESLVRLRAGKGVGLEPLLARQCKELEDERRRIIEGDKATGDSTNDVDGGNTEEVGDGGDNPGAGEQVPEVENRGDGEVDGGQPENP